MKPGPWTSLGSPLCAADAVVAAALDCMPPAAWATAPPPAFGLPQAFGPPPAFEPPPAFGPLPAFGPPPAFAPLQAFEPHQEAPSPASSLVLVTPWGCKARSAWGHQGGPPSVRAGEVC